MKAIFKSLIAFFFVGGLFYLIGSFGAATFDLTKWSDEGRCIVAIFGGISAVIAAGVIFDNYNKD